MDIAYDHIQEETLTPEQAAKKSAATESDRQQTLKAEFEETYKSFTASPWGARLGGFFSDVKKQGETFYDEAKQEASVASGEAFRGFSGLKDTLVGHARSMSNGAAESEGREAATPKAASGEGQARSDSEVLKEGDSVIKRLRGEAAKRLKDLEKAEEAADAAIFKFGANIGNFLKEAVSIAPPTDEERRNGKVLFESKDQDGKRVIHSTRFEAQLHAIHSSFDSFTKDPISPEYAKWKDDFDVEKKTEAIANDLEKYEELRRAMEKVVPEQVEYPQFWTRYYFLRMVVETEESKRREILKGAAQNPVDEPITWDDDSDDDEQSSTPQQKPAHPHDDLDSTTTTDNAAATTTTTAARDTTPTATSLKPTEPRRSQDQHSQPDSDASYDLVSGATTGAPGSPRETKGKKDDEEEEEDWE